MHTVQTADRTAGGPRLEPGVTLLSGGPDALHRVVSAELDGGRPTGLWIDPGRAVSTYTLYDLAPSPRRLGGLRIARAFTAYQHHALLRTLVREVSPRTELVVVPGIADLYRDEDVPDYERTRLFEAGVAICAELADALSIPVLCSDEGRDELTDIAAAHAAVELDAERTDEGLAIRGGGFETLGYWRRNYWQTTIPYWVQLVGALDPTEPMGPATTIDAPEPARPMLEG